MAGVFLSYARADRDRVEPLARSLEDHGWDVWWDPEVLPGDDYEQVIEHALDAADAVVCVWSEQSVKSGWVRAEARDGLERGILVPARFDGARVPLEFRGIQTADLTDWRASDVHAEFDAVVDALEKLIGPQVPPPPETTVPTETKVPTETSTSSGEDTSVANTSGSADTSVEDASEPPDTSEPDVSESAGALDSLAKWVVRSRGTWLAAGVALVVVALLVVFLATRTTNDRDDDTVELTCGDFATQQSAQSWYDARVPGWEILDADGDDVACKSLPPGTPDELAADDAPVALRVLERLDTTATEPGSAYDRDEWQASSSDADGDCQDTRHEVLIEEADGPVVLTADGCTVVSGTWDDPYTGATLEAAADVDIDHLVPTGDAHTSGGWQWSEDTKQAYANDLEHPATLIAVDDGANMSKGSKSPDEWLPPNDDYHCTYAVDWVKVKATWGLTVTDDERSSLVEILSEC